MTDKDGVVVSVIPTEDDEDGYESVEGKEQAHAGESKRWKQPLGRCMSVPLIEGEKDGRTCFQSSYATIKRGLVGLI